MFRTVIIFFILVSSAYAYSFNKHEWDGVPTVYTLGSGSSKKAVCAGVARLWVTGLGAVKTPEVKRTFILCEATAQKNGFTCPYANKCLDDTLAQGVYLGINSQYTTESGMEQAEEQIVEKRTKPNMRDIANEINQKE